MCLVAQLGKSDTQPATKALKYACVGETSYFGTRKLGKREGAAVAAAAVVQPMLEACRPSKKERPTPKHKQEDSAMLDKRIQGDLCRMSALIDQDNLLSDSGEFILFF